MTSNSPAFWIYKVIGYLDEVLYIGLTKSSGGVISRISGHCKSKWIAEYKDIVYSQVPNETMMRIYELYYINKYNPIYNIAGSNSDDVSFVSLKELDFEYSYIQERKKLYDIKKQIRSELLKKEVIRDVNYQFQQSFSLHYQNFIKETDRLCEVISECDSCHIDDDLNQLVFGFKTKRADMPSPDIKIQYGFVLVGRKMQVSCIENPRDGRAWYAYDASGVVNDQYLNCYHLNHMKTEEQLEYLDLKEYFKVKLREKIFKGE